MSRRTELPRTLPWGFNLKCPFGPPAPDLAWQFAGGPHQVQARYPAGRHCHGRDRDEFALLVDGEPRCPVDVHGVDHIARLFLSEDAKQEPRDPVRAEDGL